MSALIGAYLQQVRGGHPIEAGPVCKRVGMMNLTSHCGHQSDRVGFAMRQSPDGLDKRLQLISFRPARSAPVDLVQFAMRCDGAKGQNRPAAMR